MHGTAAEVVPGSRWHPPCVDQEPSCYVVGVSERGARGIKQEMVNTAPPCARDLPKAYSFFLCTARNNRSFFPQLATHSSAAADGEPGLEVGAPALEHHLDGKQERKKEHALKCGLRGPAGYQTGGHQPGSVP